MKTRRPRYTLYRRENSRYTRLSPYTFTYRKARRFFAQTMLLESIIGHRVGLRQAR